MLYSFLLVAAGGALGSVVRYGLAVLIGSRLFPWATFTANILGCLIIGILFGLGLKQNVPNYGWKFLGIGICGGFTTFSAFSLEGIQFLLQGKFVLFYMYLIVSVSLGLLATYFGFMLVKN